MKDLKLITLELSLKPFKNTRQQEIESVCRELFEKWTPLIRHAEKIGIMLWASDGSEILEYKGNQSEEFEWANLIGSGNQRMGWDKSIDPDGLGLHTRHYNYMKNAPVMTYGILNRIITTLKKVGKEMLDKEVKIIATFDPGPEFAKSDFKYHRHNEICVGESMGRSSMVCCYSELHADKIAYAGFPNGIPEGLPFGTFLGRQSQIFLKDMGYDAIWLSNGFGFGTETWGLTGALFDGEEFYPEKIDQTQKRILEFWDLFRKECDYPVQTRGTNNTVGVDFASDAVDHLDIYRGVKDLLPPPNSPWAALNGDFGLELAGYMSRMAELPSQDYIFRFYILDPWWASEIWKDRYGGEAHDIYLPLACARLDERGKLIRPEVLNILTADTSFGEIPEYVPNECIPHLLKAYDTFPDECAPLLWVYPFREYSTISSGRLSKPYFEDSFIVEAINNGLPLNTVVSTDNFIKLTDKSLENYISTIIVTPVPLADSSINDCLIKFIKNGGKVMLYGSLEGASEELLQNLHLKNADELKGNLKNLSYLVNDEYDNIMFSSESFYSTVTSDGGVTTVASDNAPEILSEITNGDETRVTGVKSKVGKGSIIWIRGCLKDEKTDYIQSCNMRYALSLWNLKITYKKHFSSQRSPIILISRKENAFWFSCAALDSTVRANISTPLGAPLMIGTEAYVHQNCAEYNLPRILHKECRVFIRQKFDSVVKCSELSPISYFYHRRIEVSGLNGADVIVLPRSGYENKTQLMLNPLFQNFVGDNISYHIEQTAYGPAIVAKQITGTLLISEGEVKDIPPRDIDDCAEKEY